MSNLSIKNTREVIGTIGVNEFPDYEIGQGMGSSADDDPYAKLIERRHPDYDKMLSHWKFLESTYHGGRE